MKKEEYHSSKNKALIRKLSELVNSQKYDQAIELIHSKLDEPDQENEKEQVYLVTELAGFLIDISEEGNLEKPAIDGLNILKRNQDRILKYVWDASYYYNLGNAYDSIYKIKLFQKGLEYKPKNIGLLNEAKNAHWKAYKANISTPQMDLKPYFGVNLANTLDKCGRVVEALHFYDLVLKEHPNFPKAHANRAEALLWLTRLTGSSSVNLIYQAKEGFRKASEGSGIPAWLKQEFSRIANKLDKQLKKHPDFKSFDLEHESKEIEKEFESHSRYRKFCLKNNLSLSEHALYCHCLGARRDDLMIATPSFWLFRTSLCHPFRRSLCHFR